MPSITVWPVSLSVCILNVGSSSDNLVKAVLILSWSAFDLGSIATEITGSGNIIDSSIIGFFSSHKVSPVVVFFKPTAAAISPVYTSLISVLWFACINNIRPILSLLSLFEFKT